MALFRANGTAVTKGAFPSSAPVDSDPIVQVDESLYESYELPGETGATGRRLAFRAGQRVRQSVIDAHFRAATLAAVAPATGPAAGGTVVTITGTNLLGTSGVTFGGAAATAVTVVNDETVRCTTPAHAAGAVNVVVTTQEGTETLTGGFTYA